ALIVGTLVATCLAKYQFHLETIGTRFGGIPLGFPKFHLPELAWHNVSQTWHTLHHLFLPAFTIAMLAAIESLLSAVVADGMIDDRHDSNQELVAQGIANIVSPLF